MIQWMRPVPPAVRTDRMRNTGTAKKRESNMFGKEKRCYDGYLVGKLDPVVFLMPYIMPRRTDSESKIDLDLDLTNVESFIKEHKRDIPGLTLYHIVFATVVRAAAETPEINRFITGNRIYQRRTVRISMMIKKHLEVNGRESTIYPVFETTDTLAQIVEKTNKLAEEAFAQLDGNSNAFDGFISILYAIPPFLLRGIIGFLMFLDRYGWLPKKLTELQPFHSGFFVTNVGSIGLPVIYHHLYEFGTTSVFVSIGRKEIRSELRPDGTVRTHKILPLRAVVDDRICDGFTYACAFKTIRRCFRNPDILMEAFNPDEK